MENKKTMRLEISTGTFDRIFNEAKANMYSEYHNECDSGVLDEYAFDILKALIKEEFDYIEYNPKLNTTLVAIDSYLNIKKTIFLHHFKDYLINEINLIHGLDYMLSLVEQHEILDPCEISAYDFMQSIEAVYDIAWSFDEFFRVALYKYYEK